MAVVITAEAICDRCHAKAVVPVDPPSFAEKPPEWSRIAGDQWYLVCPVCKDDFEEFMTNAR